MKRTLSVHSMSIVNKYTVEIEMYIKLKQYSVCDHFMFLTYNFLCGHKLMKISQKFMTLFREKMSLFD